MKVRDVMQTPVASMPQNGTLQDVIAKFLKQNIETLPVVDAAQRAVGLITIQELIELFLPRYHEMLRDLSALEDKGQLVSLFDLSFSGLDPTEDRLILATDIM